MLLYQRDASAAKRAAPSSPSPPSDRHLAPKDEAATHTVTGRVLDPEGKPVRGAKVYVSARGDKARTDLPVRATTGPDGRFRFTADSAEVDRNEAVVAVAAGDGPGWCELGRGEPGREQSRPLGPETP